MKDALKFILAYIIFIFSSLIIGTFFYACYLSVTNYVAGRPLSLFTSYDVLYSLFYFFGCFLFIIGPIMAYYRSRHMKGVLQTVAYIVIFGITWGLLFPLNVKLENKIQKFLQNQKIEKELSGGYFRKLGDKVYYLVEYYDEKKQIPVITIDTNAGKDVSYEIINKEDYEKLSGAGMRYRDVIIKETFVIPSRIVLINFTILLDYAKKSLRGGFISYLCFLSLALVLFSVYGCTFIFDWKLLNVCGIILITYAILSFNSLYFTPILSGFRNAAGNTGLFRLLGNVIQEPVLVVINFTVSVLFICLGIIKYCMHVNAKKGV